jgi:hypothetical protein
MNERNASGGRSGHQTATLRWQCLLALLAFLAGGVRAQTAAPERSAVQAQVAADRNRVTIGDPIKLTVTLRCPPGARALPPPPNAALAPFEVRDYQVQTRSGPGGGTEVVTTYEVAAYETGGLKIPALALGTVEADGRAGQVSTPEVPITIASVLPAGAKAPDIKDVRPPLEMKGSSLPLAACLGGLAVLLAAVAAAVILWRRRKRQATEALPATAVWPEDEAILALQELEGSALLDGDPPPANQVKDYHIRLSHILRRYVEAMFELPALEETTFELCGEMRRVEILRDHRDEVRLVLEQCDLAKFAKVTPAKERGEQALQQTRRIIEVSAREYRRREAERLRAEAAQAA